MERQYLLDAIDAALLAGGKILAIYDNPSADFEIEMKADSSPLTIADREAQRGIAEVLKSTPFPILSEEGRVIPYEERKNWNTLWIVDPLDGTKEFIKRNGEFTVNIALVAGSVPVGGVVYVPVQRTLYWAGEGRGAYKLSGISARDGKSLEELEALATCLPDTDARHEGFVVVASRSHLTAETEDYIAGLKRIHPDVKLVSSGSSIKICLVAEGKVDVYPRFAPTMEWDTAAAHAIARIAGMEIYQAGTENPLQYNKEDLHNLSFIVEKKRH